MPTEKIAITMEKSIVEQLDRWVREKKYPNRSRAIQEAVKDRLARWRKTRLIEEVAKLNPQEEKILAEQSLSAENEKWAEY